MKALFILGWFILSSVISVAQGFEFLDRQDSYQSGMSQTIRIPLRVKNTTDKPQFYIFRKLQDDLNTTQKGYFCYDKSCLEPGVEEFSKKIEPGETLQNLFFVIETGLIAGQHNLRFEVFPRGAFQQAVEHAVVVSIDDRSGRALIFHSKDVTLHEVYPNPVTDVASIDYNVHNEFAKVKVVIHNILGRAMGDYELPYTDSKIKISADELPAGVYFYTIYVNSEGVFTRKLIVRK